MKVDEVRVEKALDKLREVETAAAKARAERVYAEEWIPALRATIAAKFMASGDSATAADIKAKASPEYATALQGLKEAVEADELYRWTRARAEATIEVWRSLESSRRAQERVQ